MQVSGATEMDVKPRCYVLFTVWGHIMHGQVVKCYLVGGS